MLNLKKKNWPVWFGGGGCGETGIGLTNQKNTSGTLNQYSEAEDHCQKTLTPFDALILDIIIRM